jgi:hypothetical protein
MSKWIHSFQRLILIWNRPKVLISDTCKQAGCFPAYLLTAAFRTSLGSTQLPIQWVPGTLYLEVKRPGREAGQLPPSIVEVKECVELYLHYPTAPSWHGAQLKKGHRDNFTFTGSSQLIVMSVWKY